MTKKKYKNKQNKAKEPKAAYSKADTHFFDSFEDMDEHTARQRATLSYHERMSQIEQLRKFVFSEYLLDDGSWPPIAKVFRIMKPYTNEAR